MTRKEQFAVTCEDRNQMRRMTPILAQRVLFLSESKHEDEAEIGQKLGLPVARVREVLAHRADSAVRVLESPHGVRRKNQRVPSFSGEQCVKSI
jgi:hypothetical protein